MCVVAPNLPEQLCTLPLEEPGTIYQDIVPTGCKNALRDRVFENTHWASDPVGVPPSGCFQNFSTILGIKFSTIRSRERKLGVTADGFEKVIEIVWIFVEF